MIARCSRCNVRYASNGDDEPCPKCGDECRACAAGLPIVWHVQSKRYMHEAQGLSVTSCRRLDAREKRARGTTSSGTSESCGQDRRGAE